MSIYDEVADKIVRDNQAELDKIAELDDFIEQGYQAAPYLINGTGISPKEFALHVVAVGEPNEYNAQRDLGVIKWCLEQMAAEGK